MQTHSENNIILRARDFFSCHINLAFIVFSGVIILLCCLLNFNQVAGIVAFLALAFCIFGVTLENPLVAVKYLPLLFACVANVLGLAVIEFLPSTYLTELKTDSYFNGSMPLLCLGWWSFITAIVLFDFKKGYKCKKQKARSKDGPDLLLAFTIATLIVCIIMFSHVIMHPSFLEGIDRFKYDDLYMQGIWSKIDSLLTFLIIVPLIALKKGNKPLGLITVALYFLYQFWTGAKFGEFLTLLSIVLLVFYFKFERINKKTLRKVLLALIGAVLLLVAFAGFAHSFTSSKSLSQFYSERLAQQGQLWWKTYDSTEGVAHPEEFLSDEIGSLTNHKSISESVGEHHGIYKIMYLSASEKVVDAKLKTGARYTEAGFASSYYYFGAVGVVLFGALMGLLCAVIVNALLRAINREHFLTAAILVRLYTFSRTALSMFVFSQFLTKSSLLCFAYLIFVGVLRKNMPRGKHARTNNFFSKFNILG